MMWSSLSKLLPLPRDTLVYCAHEYTQSNARFAVTVDPNNEALQKRKVAIDEARKKVGAGLCQRPGRLRMMRCQPLLCKMPEVSAPLRCASKQVLDSWA